MKNTTYHIPHKLTLAFLISSLSLNSFAQEDIEEKASKENKTNKHFFYAGASTTNATFTRDASSKSRSTSLDAGYHYKTDSGYVFGAYYNPSLVSEKRASNLESSELDASVLGFYAGGSPFKKNKNLLVTGGFNITTTTVSTHSENHRDEDSGRGLGGNVGLWYLADRFFVGGRVSTHPISISSLGLSESGVTLGLNAGVSY